MQCPAFTPLSFELTVVSLLVLRSASDPLRVPDKVPSVSRLRTLSRPDTAPGLNTWSLHCFGFHQLSLPGALSDTGCSCCARPLLVGPLRRSRPLAMQRRVSGVGQSRSGAPGLPVIARAGNINCAPRFRRFCKQSLDKSGSQCINCVFWLWGRWRAPRA